MTVLMTGARGDVGGAVLAGLAAAGEPVRASSRAPRPGDFPAGVEVARADLADPASWPAALAGVQIAAGRHGAGQLADDRPGLLIVIDVMQDRDQGDHDRLAEVQRGCRLLQDGAGVLQVRVDIVSGAFWLLVSRARACDSTIGALVPLAACPTPAATCSQPASVAFPRDCVADGEGVRGAAFGCGFAGPARAPL